MSYTGDVVYPSKFLSAETDLHEDLETIECIVKWFNPIKGFGFVVPKRSAEDIFLHFSSVDAAGYQHLGAGTELLCTIGMGATGRQVRQILEVRNKVEGAPGLNQGFMSNRSLREMKGEVKWFNSIRGFGFVMPDEGDREVFVHSSVLRRNGLDKIHPGERVRMQVAHTDHGPQAWSVSLIDE